MTDLAFRRLRRADFDVLAEWLAHPHVERWWAHEFGPEAIERDFGPTIDGDDPAEDHIVLLGGRPIGVIQYCRFADYPEYVAEVESVTEVPQGAVSIDYLIGDPSVVGRGVGTAMIRAFVDRVWHSDPQASCFVVPVHAENEASWKALRSAGFRLVARGEMEPDNAADTRDHVVFRVDRPDGID